MHILGQLGMVGTTFRRAGQAELAAYTLPIAGADGGRANLVALARACQFSEVVYLTTCNRVEWIFVAPPKVSVAECRWRIYCYFHAPIHGHDDDLAARRQAAQKLHAFAGEGAAEHLFVVAASLDSMVPGEAQILGQVKTAFRQASQWQLTGPVLRAVFDEAFAAAKRVRQDTRLGQGAISMLSLALGAVHERLHLTTGPRLLVVVGVGEMAHQCGAIWGGKKNLQLLFVNRTVTRAEHLAARYGGQAMALENFLARPPPFAVLVTATASPKPLFDEAFFAKCDAAPCVIDLAVRRDVKPEAVCKMGGTLFDIDRLKFMAQKNRQSREAHLAQARGVIDEMLELFRRRLVEREMAPVTQALRRHFCKTLELSLHELFSRQLPTAPPAVQAQVQLWAQRLVNRMAHVSMTGLKQVGFAHGVDAANTFLQAFNAPKSEGPPR